MQVTPKGKGGRKAEISVESDMEDFQPTPNAGRYKHVPVQWSPSKAAPSQSPTKAAPSPATLGRSIGIGTLRVGLPVRSPTSAAARSIARKVTARTGAGEGASEDDDYVEEVSDEPAPATVRVTSFTETTP